MPVTPSRFARASVVSKSTGCETTRNNTVNPRAFTAASSSCRFSGTGSRVATTPNRRAAGRASFSSSTYFWLSPGTRLVRPVALVPGWARLFTNPSATGSSTKVMTIGMVAVARWAVRVSRGPVVTMASTRPATSSASIPARRSGLPKARLTTRLRPST